MEDGTLVLLLKGLQRGIEDLRDVGQDTQKEIKNINRELGQFHEAIAYFRKSEERQDKDIDFLKSCVQKKTSKDTGDIKRELLTSPKVIGFMVFSFAVGVGVITTILYSFVMN